MKTPALKELLDSYPRAKQLARRLTAVVPLSLRLGSDFWHWYAFFEESQHWTVDQLRDFQLQRVRQLLKELTRTSRFYLDQLSDVNIDNIRSLDDYALRVPHLTRHDYRRNYSQLLSSSWQTQKPVRAQTSGTTGAPLQFYHSAKDWPRELAAICHQWKRVGYDPAKSKLAQFRGLTSPGRLIDIYPEQNTLRCSILHMKPEHVRFYADAIRKHRIEFYHVYPSALYLLSDAIRTSGVVFPQPKAILMASETVYEWQLARIQSIFPEAKLFSHYGCAERTVLAGWCEFRQEYHVLPQYALVEVDSVNSEVIGTNLFNTINGFVRYRMTDTVLQAAIDKCPDCGRPYLPRLLELGGRIEDYLFSPEKGWISPAIVTYPFKSLKTVQETQLLQKDKRHVTIRYSVNSAANQPDLENDLLQIADGMHHLMGKDVAIEFDRVEEFPRTASGKFKWIVSEVGGQFDSKECL
jgi:phenylacetate-CoA ligase